jgi:predicted nucleic acid-binding protein
MTQARNIPRFDTAQIGPLRIALTKLGALKSGIGDFVRFRVVVDANFVIQELIQRIRHPERRTALEELIGATIIEAHAPRWLDHEMESAIHQTAAKRSLSADALRLEWQNYRLMLKWDDSLRTPDGNDDGQIDPKDAPYIRLQERIGAHGILSKDRHIKQMGGHPLTLDFVLSARRYARGAVTCIGIRVAGAVVSVIAIKVLIDAIGGIARGLAALPESAKVLLLLAAVAALLHPKSREWICDLSFAVIEHWVPIWNVLSEFLVAAAALANEAQTEAITSLAQASAVVRPIRPAPRRRRRARRTLRREPSSARPVMPGLAPAPA